MKGVLSPPLLMKSDEEMIRSYLGKNNHDFIQFELDIKNDKILTFLRTHAEGGCIFIKNNKCSIYDVRPLDCRIFPLDI